MTENVFFNTAIDMNGAEYPKIYFAKNCYGGCMRAGVAWWCLRAGLHGGVACRGCMVVLRAGVAWWCCVQGLHVVCACRVMVVFM